MNRILVVLEPGHPNVSAAVYAVNLAQRIKTKVSFLIMADPHDESAGHAFQKGEVGPLEERLRSLISQTGNDLRIDFYITHGPYEDELIKFVQENRINLLVVNSPPPGKQAGTNSFLDRMMLIKQEINCRIVIVSERITGKAIKDSTSL